MSPPFARRLSALLAVAAVGLVYWIASWSSIATLLSREAEARLAHWASTDVLRSWDLGQDQAVVWPGTSGLERTSSRAGELEGRLPEGNGDISLALDGVWLDLALLQSADLYLRTDTEMRARLIAQTDAGPIELGSTGVVAPDASQPRSLAIDATGVAFALRLHLDSTPDAQVTLHSVMLVRRPGLVPERCTGAALSSCTVRVPVLTAPGYLRPERLLAWRDDWLRERPASIVHPSHPLRPSSDVANAVRRAFRSAGGWLLIALPLAALVVSHARRIPPSRTRATLELAGVFGPWLAWLWAGIEPGELALDHHAFLAFWCALVAAIALRDPTPDWRLVGAGPAWRGLALFVLPGCVAVTCAGLANALDADGFSLRLPKPDMLWRYPLWAFVQQWILMRAIAPRMRVLFTSEGASALAVGALFGLLHLPNLSLMLATFAAGSCWALIGYRQRALLPLVVSHVLVGMALFALAPPWLLRSAETGVRFLMAP